LILLPGIFFVDQVYKSAQQYVDKQWTIIRYDKTIDKYTHIFDIVNKHSDFLIANKPRIDKIFSEKISQ
jgi:hypothetical protein